MNEDITIYNYDSNTMNYKDERKFNDFGMSQDITLLDFRMIFQRYDNAFRMNWNDITTILE